MAGSLSSLGIGSGTLTADIIDKLKKADEANIIDPIKKKLNLSEQKKASESLLSSYMSSLQSSASTLSYDSVFDNKNVDVDGDAKISVSSGANVSSFTLETTSLAKKDIVKFGGLDARSAVAASGDGTLEIKIGSDADNPDKTIDVSYTSGMTLEELEQAVTDATDGYVDVSILQTADDGDAYSLTLTSKSEGASQALTITDKDGNLDSKLLDAYDADTNPTGYQKIQNAQDAKFKFNGIEMTRSSNEITDLINGLDITLTKEGDTSKVKVTQDDTKVIDGLKSFISEYNTLIANINDMTIYDKDTGKKGVFNGDNFVKSVQRDMVGSVTEIINGHSLMEYGVSMDRSGNLSLDEGTFKEKLQSDPTALKEFFTGKYDDNGDEVAKGLFVKIDNRLKDYTGYGKLLSTFKDSIDTDIKSLKDSQKKSQELIDSRYAIMTKRFASYDAMINQTNTAFMAVQQMIEAQYK